MSLPDPLPIEPLDPDRPPRAVVRVPGSKSYTNRALVCALLASGRSVLTGALDADDTRAMAAAIEALGATVTWTGDRIEVEGTGGALKPGPLTLHVRDSGTCARFLAPVLARGTGRYVLDGSEQLRRRPMGPMADALRQAGVEVEGDSLPLTILGTGVPPAAEVAVPGNVTSQFVSGLMLAGFVPKLTTNLVSAPYIRMTEAVIAAFEGGATEYAIEPDASSASYFFAAAALFSGSEVVVEGIGGDSLQADVGLLPLLGAMGVDYAAPPAVPWTDTAIFGGERPQNDDGRTERWSGVRGPERLSGIAEVNMAHTPDVAQTLAAVAVFADSPTTVTGIGFTRGHETDRIAAVVTELRKLGIEADEHDDGFTVHPGTPRAGVVETYGDHRMAMSFALLGLRVPGIAIANPGCVAKTFPEFWSVLDGLRR